MAMTSIIDNNYNQFNIRYDKNTIHPYQSLITKLPPYIIQQILQYVNQFDLINLSLTCSRLYLLSIEKLYQRITIILEAELPIKYQGNTYNYIIDNGMKFMDSSLIFKLKNLQKFIKTIINNQSILQLIKYFIFDKSYDISNNNDNNDNDQQLMLNSIQCQIMKIFENSYNLNFLHISFIDFTNDGINKLTNFLSIKNIRQKMFKLLITNLNQLNQPFIPANLTNLFLLLNDDEIPKIMDLSIYPFDCFNSLFTLTCSTTNQLGLSILKNLKLSSRNMKLKLKGLTIFHRHKNDSIVTTIGEKEEEEEEDDITKLDFEIINQTIDLTYLSHLYLKIDCNEHRDNLCNCYEIFFQKFSKFSNNNNGLPNLINFEIESYPNIEWLRPHQQMENILIPLSGFIKTLKNLLRLTIDFSTPGFKMFDNNLSLSNYMLNKLNEHLIQAFFFSFVIPKTDQDNNIEKQTNQIPLLTNLKTLQLPDFFTSFIYYKPDFMESLLHTCKCWGCQLVLNKLEQEFYNKLIDENLETNFYMTIGYILGKLQVDREVCIPIKEKTFNYNKYPINKGQPHTLHNNFHIQNNNNNNNQNNTNNNEIINCNCQCNIINDPLGIDELNIDNLVTTYIIHQIDPIINYLNLIFINLNNLMIHGIYYEKKLSINNKMIPIYDNLNYPKSFLNQMKDNIDRGLNPSGPFGKFRND
ncbi:conserved hypothetical protein [Candida dubliniensis CD36]|uniref:F-box domain-containing protein n=1 Tax=Candida dubliniensis (strain CD36 / ATCC MYA-646 / CBS 7987 / NCPF 3949 / NRRL Y-17841) TaxID=573826 RepID=B9WLT0_CANDC|nr:conserved hypothetical protein [Candida dubliniensis CD36]CAX40042.1 conserved hypothetical protein [Candida dubliniensis CD36]